MDRATTAPYGREPFRRTHSPRRLYRGVVILFFEVLLVVASVAIVWFAIYVLVQLFKGQN
jgi:hypothetical protein